MSTLRDRIERLEMELTAARAGHRTTYGCLQSEMSARQFAERERTQLAMALDALRDAAIAVYNDWQCPEGYESSVENTKFYMEDLLNKTGDSPKRIIKEVLMARPTIAELEAILQNEEEVPIEILPNGEVREKGRTSSQETGGCNGKAKEENV